MTYFSTRNIYSIEANDFNNTISNVTDMLDKATRNIDKEKLKAIGHRNKVENELEDHERQEVAFNALLRKKQAELNRFQVEYDRLVRTEAEQGAHIEQLRN